MPASHYSRLDEPDSTTTTQPAASDYFNRLSSAVPDLTLNAPAYRHTFNRTRTDPETIPLTSLENPHDTSPTRPGTATAQTPYRDLTSSPTNSPPLQNDASRSPQSTLRSRISGNSLGDKLRDLGASTFSVPRIASPWDHETPSKGPPPSSNTVKEFDYRLQRKRLFINSAFQFFVTLVLCGSIAGSLVAYSKKDTLDTRQKHVFNAIITGLSIALGINLASSLRGYASMMRWRFLASSYRSLQEFELVMSCDSQMRVLRLFWIARKKTFPFVNLTQFLCVTWVFINLALQILVALIGLTYNMDQSNTYVNTIEGAVSIADLSLITDVNNSTTPTYYQETAAAQNYGIQGEGYDLELDVDDSDQTGTRTVYGDDSMTYVLYRFSDRNADNTEITLVSQRTVNATATCDAYEVIDGGYGNQTIITYIDSEGAEFEQYIETTSPGAMTYISDSNSTCGPRCTNIMAFQAADADTILSGTFFKCNNTVSPVNGAPSINSSYYELPDEQAGILAGAIGWTGFHVGNDTRQYNLYSTNTLWSPDFEDTPGDLKWHIMQFSMYAVAAMDDHGPRRDISGSQPIYAMQVTVEWQWAAALLGVIPFLQFLTLVAIIAWANKAIIKDGSFLASARLLRPVVEKLGPYGCMLTGDQIAKQMQNVRVAYGYRTPGGFVEGQDMVRHLDILEESEGLGIQRSMPRGRYDGEEEKGEEAVAEDSQIEVVNKIKRIGRRRRMSI